MEWRRGGQPLAPSSLTGGMVGGALVGFFEGLRVVDELSGSPMWRAVFAILGSIWLASAIGAIALPAAVRLADRVGLTEWRDSGGTVSVHAILGNSAAAACLAWAGFWALHVVRERLDIRRPRAGLALAMLLACLSCLIVVGVAARMRRPLRTWAAATGVGLFVLTVILGADPSTAARIDLRQRGPEGRAAAGRPNVLLVVLDTTRAQSLSTFGYEHETSPFLSEFARDATVYLDAISPAPWTVPAHASLFTGQFPSIHQATSEHRWLSSRWQTVAEVLRESGYVTAAFSSNSWVSPSFNLHQGFRDFFQVYRLPHVQQEDPVSRLFWGRVLTHLPGVSSPDKGAAMTNRLVREWLDRRHTTAEIQPFFLFINLLEPHLPYRLPKGVSPGNGSRPLRPALRQLIGDSWFKEAFRLMGTQELGPDDHRQLASLYDDELTYLDSRLRELLGDFRERGLLENTLVVIVGDHGENIGEHEGLLDHCFSMHQTVLHVPLLVRYPPLYPRGLRYPGQVSTVSVFATILEAAATKAPPDQSPAVGPLPRRAAEPGLPYAVSEYELPVFELSALATESPGTDVRLFAVRQRSIQDGHFKLIERSDGSSSFFDLHADPGEQHMLQSTASPDADRLAKELGAWVASLRPEKLPSPASEARLDPLTRESLRSLGYVQ